MLYPPPSSKLSLGVVLSTYLTLSEILFSGKRASKTAHATSERPGLQEERRREEEERGAFKTAEGKGEGEKDRDSPNGS